MRKLGFSNSSVHCTSISIFDVVMVTGSVYLAENSCEQNRIQSVLCTGHVVCMRQSNVPVTVL